MKGPKFNNEASYNTTSIEDEFMLRERALAKKLLKIVFSIDDTLSYMRKRISFEKEAIYFEYKPSLALKKDYPLFPRSGSKSQGFVSHNYRRKRIRRKSQEPSLSISTFRPLAMQSIP